MLKISDVAVVSSRAISCAILKNRLYGGSEAVLELAPDESSSNFHSDIAEGFPLRLIPVLIS